MPKFFSKPLLTAWGGNVSLKMQYLNVMSDSPEQSPSSKAAADSYLPVKFIHEKNPQFRTYHADGVWPMVSGCAEVNINFYAESPRIASGSTHEVDPKTGLYTGKFELQWGSDPQYHIVMRDFQCCLVLPIIVAERLLGLLPNIIESAKKQRDAQAAFNASQNK
jgi:hypothetical protein